LIEAHPLHVQLDARLTRSAPLAIKEFVHIKGRFAREHVIDGPSQFMSQDGQGVALTMFFLQAGQLFLPCRIVAQEQRGGFGKGPLEVRVPNFLAGGA
jgi:hypothetical protein